MARHIVKFKDARGYTVDVEIAGSFGKGDNKSLKAQITFDTKEIVFKVENQGKIVAKEQDLESAINVYNDL